MPYATRAAKDVATWSRSCQAQGGFAGGL